MKTRTIISWLGSSVLAKMMLRTLAVLTISILIVEWVAYRESSKQIISLTERQQLSLTELFAERFDRAMERIAADMQTVSNLPSLEEYSLNRQYDLLTEADQQLANVAAFLTRVWRSDPGYARIEIVDSQGTVVLVVTAGESEFTPTASLQARAHDAPSLPTPELMDEGIQTLVSDGSKALVYSRPLGDRHANWGTLRTYYRLDSLTVPLARERLAQTGHLAVIADDGELIYSPEGAALRDGSLVAELSVLAEGTHEVSTKDGRRLLVSASSLESKNWRIAALVPRKELLSGLDTTLRLVVALIAINVAVEFIFIFWFARRYIIKPIKGLLTGTQEVLDGNYGYRVEGIARDEFGTLAASFNTMTASMERTLAELHRREDQLSKTAAAFSNQTELLRALLSAIPAPIFHKDTKGVYLGCNAAFAEMLGRTEEEIIGRTVYDVASPEYAAIWAEGDQKAMQSQTSISHEATVVGPDGEKRRYVVHKSVFSRGDKPGGVVGVMLDITERRELEAQLLHSQKLEAIGVLVSGVAHDFNNVLQVIGSYTRVLLPQTEAGDAQHHALLQIQRATTRAAELIRDMMTFSRKKIPELQQVDLNSAIAHALRLIERTIPRMILVEHEFDTDIERVEADPSQLEQVLVNMATNARDAMPEGGLLHFSTSRVVLDRAFCRSRPALEPGPHAVLKVSDTGIGMDTEIKDRVFEPFFTTKEVGVGTGLGLASVYGVVRAHSGHIECRSKPGKGTEFSIYLPIPKTQTQLEKKSKPVDSEPHGGGETILIVDDDPGVLESTKMLLEAMGYLVVTATSGEDALALWSNDISARTDLIILDLGMPGMGGRHCLRRLVELDPYVKVIVATGYGSEQEELAMKEAGARDFIGKPYRFEDMDRKIRAILQEPTL
ncbi:MAG: response regulator [bacterium]|nr:response regulator [bacterium]